VALRSPLALLPYTPLEVTHLLDLGGIEVVFEFRSDDDLGTQVALGAGPRGGEADVDRLPLDVEQERRVRGCARDKSILDRNELCGG
jgi:hypothetical protein